MTSHLPPSPLRVCWYAAFPLGWLGALPQTRVFRNPRLYRVILYIYVYEYIRIYTNLNG